MMPETPRDPLADRHWKKGYPAACRASSWRPGPRSACIPWQAIPKGVRLPVSENAKKARTRLSRLHARIANIRQDALHKLTSDLTRRFHTISIEDLNVHGILTNHYLACSISDMSLFGFRRQLKYKAGRSGGMVVVADRGFASSRTFPVCAVQQDKMPLAFREWTCPDGGAIHDRDVNAAWNFCLLVWWPSAALREVPPDVTPVESVVQVWIGLLERRGKDRFSNIGRKGENES